MTVIVTHDLGNAPAQTIVWTHPEHGEIARVYWRGGWCVHRVFHTAQGARTHERFCTSREYAEQVASMHARGFDT
jgi:hypothetical protein